MILPTLEHLLLAAADHDKHAWLATRKLHIQLYRQVAPAKYIIEIEWVAGHISIRRMAVLTGSISGMVQLIPGTMPDWQS
jgi:hypothetical protein